MPPPALDGVGIRNDLMNVNRLSGKQPPNNARQAARYCLPGLIAHQSATQGGALLPIPDLGFAPS